MSGLSIRTPLSEREGVLAWGKPLFKALTEAPCGSRPLSQKASEIQDLTQQLMLVSDGVQQTCAWPDLFAALSPTGNSLSTIGSTLSLWQGT
jgi:hypothetical protein